jgi:hypothetical protein
MLPGCRHWPCAVHHQVQPVQQLGEAQRQAHQLPGRGHAGSHHRGAVQAVVRPPCCARDLHVGLGGRQHVGAGRRHLQASSSTGLLALGSSSASLQMC